MSHAVKVAVDEKGCLLLPEGVREAAGMRPGVPFEVKASQGRIEMKRAESKVDLVRQGRLTVAVAEEDLPPVTDRETLELRRQLRESRTANY